MADDKSYYSSELSSDESDADTSSKDSSAHRADENFDPDGESALRDPVSSPSPARSPPRPVPAPTPVVSEHRLVAGSADSDEDDPVPVRNKGGLSKKRKAGEALGATSQLEGDEKGLKLGLEKGECVPRCSRGGDVCEAYVFAKDLVENRMPVVKGDVKTVYESARKFASRRFAKETKRMQDALDEAEDKARKADEMNVAFRRYAAHLEGDAGAVVATLKRLEKEEASQKRLREELEAELEEARRDRARVAAKEARMKKEWADTCAAWKKRQEADKRDAEAERKRMEESERAALAAAESERRRREEAERAVAAAVEAERRRWEDADREAAEERQRRREYKERKRWAKKEARRAERRAEEEAEGHWDGRDAGRDEPVRVLAEDATTADEGEADETDAGEVREAAEARMEEGQERGEEFGGEESPI
eukprot:jgi/Mesvir1/14073/Mv20404-RA.1